MPNHIIPSFFIAIAILILVRLAHHFWEKSRRKFFAPLIAEKELIQVLEPLALNITVSRRYLSFRPNRNNRALGRLVIQDSCVQLSSSTGILMRARTMSDLTVKALGTRRLVLLGKSPSSEVELRIECTVPQEKILQEQITQALQ
jgi:hypothetical protein